MSTVLRVKPSVVANRNGTCQRASMGHFKEHAKKPRCINWTPSKLDALRRQEETRRIQ